MKSHHGARAIVAVVALGALALTVGCSQPRQPFGNAYLGGGATHHTGSVPDRPPASKSDSR